jgi:hypothetical protein
VYLTHEVANVTAQLVASFGRSRRPHEGIVYWAGISTASAWMIVTTLVPDAETTPGSYRTSVRANAYVIKAVSELRLQLLAQVHGHPTDWVNHSEGDNTGAFMPYDGFLSVVLPWYGSQGMLPLEKCGIHRFGDGHFINLDSQAVERQFVVVPSSVDLRRKFGHLWR